MANENAAVRAQYSKGSEISNTFIAAQPIQEQKLLIDQSHYVPQYLAQKRDHFLQPSALGRPRENGNRVQQEIVTIHHLEEQQIGTHEQGPGEDVRQTGRAHARR